jgi:hypothetical protein
MPAAFEPTWGPTWTTADIGHGRLRRCKRLPDAARYHRILFPFGTRAGAVERRIVASPQSLLRTAGGGVLMQSTASSSRGGAARVNFRLGGTSHRRGR